MSMGQIGPSALVAGVAGLGLLLVIIRWVSFPTYHGSTGLNYNVGARYGIFLALIAGIAEVTAAVMQMRASTGEAQSVAPAEPDPPAAPEAPPAPEE
jgi:hypothetical protein